jgi:hypothetical protein
MKIIATTNGGFICEVSRREVSLLGIASPTLGEEIPLDRAFDTLSSLRSISQTNLRYIGDEITKLQQKYDVVADIYSKTMLFDSIKTSEGTK